MDLGRVAISIGPRKVIAQRGRQGPAAASTWLIALSKCQPATRPGTRFHSTEISYVVDTVDL